MVKFPCTIRAFALGAAGLFSLFPAIAEDRGQTAVAVPPQTALSDADWQKLPPHPRLFADDARFNALKAQKDDVSAQLVALLRRGAAKHLMAAPVTYPAEGNILESMRQMQSRILTLAMMYRLTDDRRYFARARQELLALAARSDWGVGHFLDVAEASLAAGIGLDWLYDDLSQADRDAIAHAIVNHALLPSLQVKDEPGSWLNGDFNWNQVCHGGLAVGALAIADREPELARQIVERAVKNVPTAAAAYAPDGSCAEGTGYWSYGATFNVFLIEALRSALGTSAGLENLPGFLKSADFKLQMVGPTGEAFNFSDHHAEHDNDPVMLWFARELDRHDIARPELQAVADRAGTSKNPPNETLRINRHIALELLWWKPGLSHPKVKCPLHWTAGGHLPIAVLRSAWDEPSATYLAIKGGTPNGSHAHMDAGSFILEADGVRWALDPGTENYDKMRAAKIDLWNYTQASTRWTVFRCGPEAHNIPRFDGARQDIDGKAEIQALLDEDGVIGNTVELTSLYHEQVESIRRTVKLLPDRSVTIEDQWTTGTQPVNYSFQWLTKAEVTTRGNRVRLEQSGETLMLTIESSGESRIEIEDVSQPKALQDSPNPGFHRIVIHEETAAQGDGFLKITAVPNNVPPPVEP